MRIDDLEPAVLDGLIESGFNCVGFHKTLDVHIAALEPEVVIEMPLTQSVQGALTPVHGGALAGLIDVAISTAAAFAEGFELGQNQLLTLDTHVRFVSQPTIDSACSGLVRACASIVHEAGRNIHLHCRVEDVRTGRLLVLGDAASVISRLPAPPA